MHSNHRLEDERKATNPSSGISKCDFNKRSQWKTETKAENYKQSLACGQAGVPDWYWYEWGKSVSGFGECNLSVCLHSAGCGGPCSLTLCQPQVHCFHSDCGFVWSGWIGTFYINTREMKKENRCAESNKRSSQSRKYNWGKPIKPINHITNMTINRTQVFFSGTWLNNQTSLLGYSWIHFLVGIYYRY